MVEFKKKKSFSNEVFFAEFSFSTLAEKPIPLREKADFLHL